MKRIFILLLVLALCFICVGCNDPVDTDNGKEPPARNFEFSYQFDEEYVSRNKKYEFGVAIKNISGEDVTWSGDDNELKYSSVLYTLKDGEKYEIKLSSTMSVSGETGEVLFSKGGTRQQTYEMKLTADAPAGIYDLEISHRGETDTFKNAFTVVGVTDGTGANDFSFEYKRYEQRGTFHVDVINSSGKDYIYHGYYYDFIPMVELYCVKNGTEHVFQAEIWLALPDAEMSPETIVYPSGAKNGCEYFFDLKNAPKGSYNLRVKYKNSETVFENVLTVE